MIPYSLPLRKWPRTGVSRFFVFPRACRSGRARFRRPERGSCALQSRAEALFCRLLPGKSGSPSLRCGKLSARSRHAVLRFLHKTICLIQPAMPRLIPLAACMTPPTPAKPHSSLAALPAPPLASGLRGDLRPPPERPRTRIDPNGSLARLTNTPWLHDEIFAAESSARGRCLWYNTPHYEERRLQVD